MSDEDVQALKRPNENAYTAQSTSPLSQNGHSTCPNLLSLKRAAHPWSGRQRSGPKVGGRAMGKQDGM